MFVKTERINGHAIIRGRGALEMAMMMQGDCEMKATLTFVPPGGGEADYHLDFDLFAAPQPGDYICIDRADPENPGTEDFIVRRTWWYLKYPDSGDLDGPEIVGSVTSLIVECELARGPFSSEGHKKNCKIYTARGKRPQEFQASTY